MCYAHAWNWKREGCPAPRPSVSERDGLDGQHFAVGHVPAKEHWDLGGRPKLLLKFLCIEGETNLPRCPRVDEGLHGLPEPVEDIGRAVEKAGAQPLGVAGLGQEDNVLEAVQVEVAPAVPVPVPPRPSRRR